MRLIDADALPYEKQVLSIDEEWCLKVADIDATPTIEQPTWISCAERLPTEGGTYLVCQDFSMWGVEHKTIGIEQFVKQFGGWYCDGLKIKGITHWMHLPMPPKGDE